MMTAPARLIASFNEADGGTVSIVHDGKYFHGERTSSEGVVTRPQPNLSDEEAIGYLAHLLQGAHHLIGKYGKTDPAQEHLMTSIAHLSKANQDCLAKAKPGEPVFIILGRDPDGGNITRLWGARRLAAGDRAHGAAVLDIADDMNAWREAGNLPNTAPPADAYPPLPLADGLGFFARMGRAADRLLGLAPKN